MSEKKPVDKKSLTVVRPVTGSFKLAAFPDETFVFRKIVLDDEVWVKETFGKALPDLFAEGQTIEMVDLCRLWFHFLSDESKQFFPFKMVTAHNYDTGLDEEVPLSGYRHFMKKVEQSESMKITEAFHNTVLASRPVMSEEFKKKLEAATKELKAAKKAENQPNA